MTWTSGQPIFSVDGLSSSAILGPGMQLSGGSTAFQQVRVSDAHPHTGSLHPTGGPYSSYSVLSREW